ncbi:Type III restriction enzyme, res subunit [Gaiella occulta]|uniref:Type III restriction enzyme, res subunit n=1 Tax=Gaiella occulta TaxID=1002870 RepID=A0A7M2YTR9_9ACTN|nr:DEAD/DEAH box helicase family protein [Gaiella occulta]RDI73541.1 Type III restriction enzyme, res subunit [Gaiella occulta]
MADLNLFEDAIAEIAARLDLREPNREAVRTINAAVSQYYDVEEQQPPFEAVIDSATGVGKTYILAGAMELFAGAYGVRDFVIVTPGRTILEKTKDNFTPGHPKSLLGPMSFQPVVITSENFATPAMRAAMDDETQVKIYLFTVQSLIRPESKTGRRTHKFQEGLGTEFYGHLQSVGELVVFADEHHCYYGPAFSKAVRDLNPWVLIGLTATPDKKTPLDQIIFRYPLAAAIADKLVKTPVIVGRKDDRADPLTKLSDGVTLLNAKAAAIDSYAQATEMAPVNPVMLVVAKSIEDADEYGAILRSSEFFGGAYADAVLVVHSNAPDEALADLAKVEDPTSPVRIIISVGMLKEGWDVRNVYVVASMRASVSEILTEQTLGRGMRLPFGAYTGIEILDTLEVVAHERYEDLLKKAGVLNQAFVDYRTWAALRTNAQGKTVVVTESIEAGTSPLVMAGDIEGPLVLDGQSSPVVTSVEQRASQVNEGALKLKQTILPRPDAPVISVPVLRMSAVQSSFTLADITDTDPFRKLGAALATNPDDELSRTLVGARIVTGPDGIKRTELIRSTAADRIRSIPTLFDLNELRTQLVEMVLASSAVPARANQRVAVVPIIDAFFTGLGDKADDILSANLGRAGARLVALVAAEQRRFMVKPSYEEVVELREFNPTRATDKAVTADRLGPFLKSITYEGWRRSVYPVAWFDSEPERRVANMVDGDDGVSCWLRLHVNDLPILWNSGGQEYNPDLIVIENDGTHWVVEVKMDKEVGSEDVQGKREAAKRWANHVTADPQVGVTWRYLLVSEADIKTAKGSWPALRKLGA